MAFPPPTAGTNPDDNSELEELLAEVRRIEVQSRRLVADMMAGGYASVFRGAGMEFQEVREYEDGDDPRSVDWNVTARMGRPYIKKFKDERDLSVVLLVDMSPSMHAGCGAWSPRQMAARIGACLALTAVRSGDKIGMVAFADQVEKHVPLGPGYPHALRIIRDCLGWTVPPRPLGGQRSSGLSAALQHLGHVVPRRAVVFVLSDFTGQDWHKPLARSARRHDVTAVHLLTPERIPRQAHHEGPRPGPHPGGTFFDHLTRHNIPMTRVADPETGRELLLDWRSQRVRLAWAEAAEQSLETTRDHLRRAGVDIMPVPIPLRPHPDAVARPVVDFFRMRQAKGSR